MSAEYFRQKISIESLGGNGGKVTGSCHKLQIRNTQIMIDFGLFQGRGEEKMDNGKTRNSQFLDSDLRGVSDIFLTHSHIDHIGRLPMIFRQGFKPRVYMTEAAVEIAEKMLNNSAKNQKKRGQEFLYSERDIDLTLRYLRGMESFKEFSIGEKGSKIVAEFLPNGHILGSSSIWISDRKNPHAVKNILFSGDIGRPIQPISGGYEDFAKKYPKDPVHAMFLESTNFDREPVSFKKGEDQMLSTIKETWNEGGNIVIAVISQYRAPTVFETIHHWQIDKKIPKDCRIYIDAPFAMELLGLYRNQTDEHFLPRYGDDPEFYKSYEESLARFDLENVVIIDSHEDSLANDKKMANYKGKAIIIASGAMLEHGRSVVYRNGEFCKNPKNTVILTSYQVEGTEGARILHREFDKEAKKNLETHDKKGRLIGARVVKIDGFTGHASGPEIIDFTKRFNLDELRMIDIGHGQDSSRNKEMEDFERRGYKKVFAPKLRQRVEAYI